MVKINPNFRINKLSNGFGSLLVMVIGLFIIPIYANVVDLKFITILGVYLALSAASLSLDFGLIQRFVREISEKSEQIVDKVEYKKIFDVGKVLTIRIVIFSIPIICITFILLKNSSDYVGNNITSVIFVSFLVLSALMRVLSTLIWSFLLAKNQHIQMNILKVTFNVIVYITPILLYKASNDYHTIFISQFFVQCIFFYSLYFFSHKKYKVRIFDEKIIKYQVFTYQDNFQKSVFFISLISLLMFYADRFYLTLVLDENIMGTHIFYVTFYLAIMGIVGGVANTFYPSIVDAHEKKDYVRRDSLLVRMGMNSVATASICVVIVLLFRELEVMRILNINLDLGDISLPIYLFAALLNSCIVVVYFYQLCVRNVQYALFYNLGALIVFVPLNVYLASHFQLVGTAFALVLAQFVLILGALTVVIYWHKNYNLVKLLIKLMTFTFLLLFFYKIMS